MAQKRRSPRSAGGRGPAAGSTERPEKSGFSDKKREVPTSSIAKKAREFNRDQSFLPDVSPVNLNTAAREELDTLPGIGPALAQRIVDYRTANGPFETVEELLEVSGIGEATLAELEDRVTVDPAEQAEPGDAADTEQGDKTE